MSTHRIYPFIIFQFLSFFSLFLRQFEQISDVLFGERSRLIPRGKNISDLHIIIHLKRTRDDLRAIQFLANHAAADRVSVETYKQVEQGCPVPNNDFFSALQRAEDLLRKIVGIVLPLLVRETRIWGQIFQSDHRLFCQRIVLTDEYMGLGPEQRCEFQSVLMQRFLNDRFIE